MPADILPPATTMVAIPFRHEDPELVVSNLRLAASHPAVAEVLAIGGDHPQTNQAIADLLEADSSISLRNQERWGSLRPGKGDAVNTGFHYFIEKTDWQRLHIYDADIRTFSREWISKAEGALDLGYQAVRHYYPRAATDAMITWMITRPGFALLWPDSPLPWIEQPLSGELAFTREAVGRLAADPVVCEQSDWGIDTVITHRSAGHGLSIYESYIAEGKDHTLYSSLADIKTMMLECLAAIQRLRTAPAPLDVVHRTEYPHAVSVAIAQTIGFDLEMTQRLLAEGWTQRQHEMLAAYFDPDVAAAASRWLDWPDTSVVDEARWLPALRSLLDHFDLHDQDWQELAFRLWVGRVLHYATRVAVRGHAFSTAYLHDMVRRSIAASR